MTQAGNPEERLSMVKALIELSRADLLYSGEYLYRSEIIFHDLLSRERYLSLHRDQEQLPQVTAELREAAEEGDWERVRDLAERADGMRDRIAERANALPLADAVYGPRSFHADAIILGLHGVIGQPAASLARLKSELTKKLELLAEDDAEWSWFYASRRRHFEALEPDSGGASPNLDEQELRKRVLEAADAGSFDLIRSLTQVIPNGESSASGRLRAPQPLPEHVRSLGDPIPEPQLDRARELGLEAAVLPASADLNQYLSCGCAEGAKLPDEPLREIDRDSSKRTCGHACPPGITPRLRETLDFLLGHTFITSAGDRYLPWFGTETVLVESFPESEPNMGTALLSRLRLEPRQGASRMAIENSLLTHGPHLIRELGLDPLEFQLTCIPFDAYLRLAPKYSWGKKELWTHFDSYQVTRELKLWSVVGGHSHYGGPEDLSSIAREYESDHLTARFAIVRRGRFLAREDRDSIVPR